ncbi:GNAT family N-acetyltransferase [Vibrio albus]|uniref:GNAT family N-acetyltransferase n=1 Tax=Vibrio albus TaxID=2200953 RepID=A0A2U3B4M5_9VIBR|nr:GNAT family N-acetyltransferase [Vibrio albus]PWI31727.1 GNAT family N-acetyltransferase [Vibrio albus]
MNYLETERLILRQWKREDYAQFAKLNADPRVMRFFPSVLNLEESNKVADHIRGLIEENGWGFWAVELKSGGQFIGFVGLNYQPSSHSLPETPFVEVGWRLSSKYWGKGLAPEAAGKALDFAFSELGLDSVYAFTPLINKPSQRVMQKLGMQNTGNDFNHPKVERGHRVERHCLYKISKERWLRESA